MREASDPEVRLHLAFDGDFAFRAADTLGYPAELALEEAERVGMTIDPGWRDRYEELRAEQQERSTAK